MASPTRGQPRNSLYFVDMGSVNYAFRTKDPTARLGIAASDLTMLGWTALTGAVVAVFGADKPKPARATKKLAAGGSFSGFCAPGRMLAARADGWSITELPQYPDNIISPLMQVVMVKTPTISTAGAFGVGTMNYGFYIRKDDAVTYAVELGQLGIDVTVNSAALNNMIMGANAPKPGRAKKTVTGGASFSAYYDPSKHDDMLSSADWRIIESPRVA